MPHVFVSYARSTEAQAKHVADALRSLGHEVWWDEDLPAHRAYSEVIEERLQAAGAVVVLWSAEAAKSQWVRAEADAARAKGTLIQVSLDGTVPPMPFNQIQCADLKGWEGDAEAPGWRKVERSVVALVGAGGSPGPRDGKRGKSSICVLPFANMSGDTEQEYFSDGISEDITTDLSKISALAVTARNSAFMFKGQAVDVCDVARKLDVSHVLEGSVRKAGSRLRITAQLIDGQTGEHVWAERYDRELTDIFAIQDEISKAIVDALKIKLLPEEKKAIEHRGTTNADAYNLYLMARQQWISGNFGDPRRDEAIVRVCKQATKLDPGYAQAWALMALAQAELRFVHGKDENALPAADRALELNAELPEAHCIKARYLEEEGKTDEAEKQVRTALKLDPDSWEVNREAARMLFRRGRAADAIPFFQKAASQMETDWHNPLMLITCYASTGKESELRDVAKTVFERAERAVGKEATNGQALAAGANALVILGDTDRARDWSRRALLLDPENLIMCYNLACALAHDGMTVADALDAIQPFFERVKTAQNIRHLEADPDLDPLRDHPRFIEMLAGARERLGIAEAAK